MFDTMIIPVAVPPFDSELASRMAAGVSPQSLPSCLRISPRWYRLDEPSRPSRNFLADRVNPSRSADRRDASSRAFRDHQERGFPGEYLARHVAQALA